MGIELKNGYRVKLKNGYIGIYIEEKIPYIYESGYKLTYNIEFYDGSDDWCDNNSYKIIEVYDVSSEGNYWQLYKEDLLWSYDQSCEQVEMTFAEIEEKLGHKVKIVG